MQTEIRGFDSYYFR